MKIESFLRPKLIGLVCIFSALILALPAFFLINESKNRIIETNTQHVEDLLLQFQSYEEFTTLYLKNAAEYLRLYDKSKNSYTNEEMIKIKNDLNVSDIFVIDKTGDFINATNGPREKQPENFFALCEGYKDLVHGTKNYDETPILIAHPSQETYKFVMIPNYNRTKVLEVGLKLDYINKALGKALSKSNNILAMSFFTPTGLKLGQEGIYKKDFGLLNKSISFIDDKFLVIEKKLLSNQKSCCECRLKNLVSGTGDYYYIVQSVVSLEGHNKFRNTLIIGATSVFLLILLITFLMARRVSNKLSSGINKATDAIKSTRLQGTLLPVNINEDDFIEVSNLKSELNNTIHSIKVAQNEIGDSKKINELKTILKNANHDIRGALDSFHIAMEQSRNEIPSGIFTNFTYMKRRVVGVLSDLPFLAKVDTSTKFELFHLTVTEIIENFESRHDIKIKLNDPNSIFKFLIVKLDSSIINRIVNNILNNAYEACLETPRRPLISMDLNLTYEGVKVSFIDNGKGLPAIFNLGESSKSYGSGIGLKSTKDYLSQIGGALNFPKTEVGTNVEIFIPHSAIVWAVSCLNREDQKLNLIDDEKINYINLKSLFSNIEINYFQNQDQLEKATTLFETSLIDYALDGDLNGVELSKKVALKSKNILFTSMYWHEIVLKALENDNYKILPKPNLSNTSVTGTIKKVVILDDDLLAIRNCQKPLENAGLDVSYHTRVEEFFKSFTNSSDTLYLIDSNLSGKCGVKIYQVLHALNLNVSLFSFETNFHEKVISKTSDEVLSLLN